VIAGALQEKGAGKYSGKAWIEGKAEKNTGKEDSERQAVGAGMGGKVRGKACLDRESRKSLIVRGWRKKSSG
jgi:hypothetical protein